LTPVRPLIALTELLLYISVAGLFGGLVSGVLDNFKIPNHTSFTNQLCYKCSFKYFVGRALIGVAGAFGAIFLGISLGQVAIEDNVKNIVFIISMSMIAGTISYRLLPKIGTKLEEKLLVDKIAQTEKKADDALKSSHDAINYTSAIAHAETALSRVSRNDTPQAIERLESIREGFPIDRTLHIYLARLYRKLGDYDKAILILREFISNLDKGGRVPHSRYIVDRADAYFNIACYHALKAKENSSRDISVAELSRLKREALESLSSSVNDWSRNKEYARTDEDFDFIRSEEEFSIITAET
jgi:tetratricopeptide (TPR) repeat protein